MADEEITSLRLRIEGFVQGVGYRAFAAAEASRLGLSGWIRNRADRTVEVLVSGSTQDVEAFVAACMRGPAGARVENAELHNVEPPAEQGFRQRPTL